MGTIDMKLVQGFLQRGTNIHWHGGSFVGRKQTEIQTLNEAGRKCQEDLLGTGSVIH